MKINPIIVALDVESATQARELVRRIDGAADFYKVGLELYAAAGSDFVTELIEDGHRVFLDLKFYDIGETVRRAVAQVVKLGVTFLTVHGSNAVMKAAIEGRADSSLRLLGVTVLTSFDESDLKQLGYPCNVADLVSLRVRNAMESGLDGIVCSPLEIARVRGITGPGATLVIPGVRSPGAGAGDQKRVATPKEAIQNGADYLVIGRQIIRSENPNEEIRHILSELAL